MIVIPNDTSKELNGRNEANETFIKLEISYNWDRSKNVGTNYNGSRVTGRMKKVKEQPAMERNPPSPGAQFLPTDSGRSLGSRGGSGGRGGYPRGRHRSAEPDVSRQGERERDKRSKWESSTKGDERCGKRKENVRKIIVWDKYKEYYK